MVFIYLYDYSYPKIYYLIFQPKYISFIYNVILIFIRQVICLLGFDFFLALHQNNFENINCYKNLDYAIANL